jgi:hypothetical protein
MSKDGRITIPKLTDKLLKEEYKEQDIAVAIFDVKFAPSEAEL